MADTSSPRQAASPMGGDPDSGHRANIAPFPLGRDVFDAMETLERQVRSYKKRTEGGTPLDSIYAVWLCDRVLNVLQTIKDANVTYGIIEDNGETVTPMMVERDAIVGALDA